MSLRVSYTRLLSRNSWAQRECESALAQGETRLRQLHQRLAELADQGASLRLLAQSLAPQGMTTRNSLFSIQRKQAVIKTRQAELRTQEAAIRQAIEQAGIDIEQQKIRRQLLIRKQKKYETGYQRLRREHQLKRQRVEDNDAEESIYANQR